MVLTKIVLITLLSPVVIQPTMAAMDAIAFALRAIGAGSVAEMESRIFSLPFSLYGAEDCRRAIALLPQSRRESKITEGKLLRRVELIIKPVLKLHNRTDRVELFLYHDRFPQATLWMGCILVMSDSLAELLNDDELAGIVAHEMAHAYFMVETIKAKKHGDHETMRIVELKCDAVAMLTLELLGQDPADHLRALRQVTNLTKSNGYKNSINSWDYPSITDRAQFAQRFIKLLS